MAPTLFFPRRSQQAYAADGDFRVGGITEGEITEKAIQARDQILKFFINLAGLLANFTSQSLTATGISEKTMPA